MLSRVDVYYHRVGSCGLAFPIFLIIVVCGYSDFLKDIAYIVKIPCWLMAILLICLGVFIFYWSAKILGNFIAFVSIASIVCIIPVLYVFVWSDALEIKVAESMPIIEKYSDVVLFNGKDFEHNIGKRVAILIDSKSRLYEDSNNETEDFSIQLYNNVSSVSISGVDNMEVLNEEKEYLLDDKPYFIEGVLKSRVEEGWVSKYTKYILTGDIHVSYCSNAKYSDFDYSDFSSATRQ